MWSKPFEYAFTIYPPWWHSWWARAGYAITAVMLILGFVRWRTAKLKQRQKELELTTVMKYDEKFQVFLALALLLITAETIVRESKKVTK